MTEPHELTPRDELVARIATLETALLGIERQLLVQMHINKKIALFLAEHGWGFSDDD